MGGWGVLVKSEVNRLRHGRLVLETKRKLNKIQNISRMTKLSTSPNVQSREGLFVYELGLGRRSRSRTPPPSS